ncbi:MAG: hypothetical protein K8E24_002950 [Methanobacterium paludis]|nr:hypothetical protein [Methanobacterium paludis]
MDPVRKDRFQILKKEFYKNVDKLEKLQAKHGEYHKILDKNREITQELANMVLED